jgi:hypothetical protein
MGPVVMIYIPSFINIGSGIQELIEGGDKYTDIQISYLISLLLFFQNDESRLKRVCRCKIPNK